MKWRGRRTSSNIEDRRGAGSGGLGRFRRMRGGRRVRMPGGRGKIGGLGLIIIVVLALAFGVDPTFLLQGTLQDGGGTGFSIPPGNAPSAPNRIGIGLRGGQRGIGAILLPGRQQGLSGHGLLPDHGPPAWRQR
jgi:hypothetical protein